eukprot:UN13960
METIISKCDVMTEKSPNIKKVTPIMKSQIPPPPPPIISRPLIPILQPTITKIPPPQTQKSAAVVINGKKLTITKDDSMSISPENILPPKKKQKKTFDLTVDVSDNQSTQKINNHDGYRIHPSRDR